MASRVEGGLLVAEAGLNPKNETCYLCGEAMRDEGRDLIAALSGTSREYSGYVVAETPNFVVLPSLGPLAEGHVLVSPIRHVAGFGRVDSAVGAEFIELKRRMRGLLEEIYGSAVHGFEHGAGSNGRIPCSVEHAHFHLLPVPISTRIEPRKAFAWKTFDGSIAALAAITNGSEYLWYEDPFGRANISVDGPFPSQYLRIVFAAALGVADWNWRLEPRLREVHSGFVRVKAAWETAA
jgi:diadenosine tetraphosphate (Ap4A) HIT family hydrolase